MVGFVLIVYVGVVDVLVSFVVLGFIKGGEIVVVVFDGYIGCVVVGDCLIGMYKNFGVIGFVIDGFVCDYVGVVVVGLFVWCDGLILVLLYMFGFGIVGCFV